MRGCIWIAVVVPFNFYWKMWHTFVFHFNPSFDSLSLFYSYKGRPRVYWCLLQSVRTSNKKQESLLIFVTIIYRLWVTHDVDIVIQTIKLMFLIRFPKEFSIYSACPKNYTKTIWHIPAPYTTRRRPLAFHAFYIRIKNKIHTARVELKNANTHATCNIRLHTK